MDTTIGTYFLFRSLSVVLARTYGVPPDDTPEICRGV
jgi:hypothetical protein